MKQKLFLLAIIMVASAICDINAQKIFGNEPLNVNPRNKKAENLDLALAFAKKYCKDDNKYDLKDVIDFANTGIHESRTNGTPEDEDDYYFDAFEYLQPYQLIVGGSDLSGGDVFIFHCWKKSNGHALFMVMNNYGNDCYTQLAIYDYNPLNKTLTPDTKTLRQLQRKWGHNFGNSSTCMHRVGLEKDGICIYDLDDYACKTPKQHLHWNGADFVAQKTHATKKQRHTKRHR